MVTTMLLILSALPICYFTLGQNLSVTNLEIQHAVWYEPIQPRRKSVSSSPATNLWTEAKSFFGFSQSMISQRPSSTGDFYHNRKFSGLIKSLKSSEHYVSAHSDKHLLYCSWEQRDSLLVSESEFKQDLLVNYEEMKKFGIDKSAALYFMPPYE